jgi:hypothetical protein
LRPSYSHVARWVLGAVWLSLGAACEEDAKPLTQIVVVVDSDLPVPDVLDALHMEVSGTKPMPEIDTPLDADHTLPRTLGLVYSGGKLGPLRVLARGMRHGDMVVERMADVTFQKDRTVKLALALTHECVQKPACPEDQTCDHGECVPSVVTDLPVFDGKDGSFLPDAGPYRDPVPTFDSGAADGGGDAAQDAATEAGAEAGRRDAIVCTVTKPTEGATFYTGDEVTFEGSCVDADGMQIPVLWLSTLEEGNLGTKMAFKRNTLNAGTHEISLCANNTTTCAVPPVHITVQPLPEISATIHSLAQAGATEGVYKADTELIANGEATGVPPLAISWIDSLAGEVCTTTSCRFDAPLLTGRHTLRLIVVDARGRKQTAERSFVVHAPGQNALFQAYAVANSVLSASGTVSALASDGTYHFVGTENGYLLQVQMDASASTSPSITPTSVTEPRPRAADIFVHRSSNKLYLATSADVQVCDISNATVSNCMKQPLGGFAAAVPRSIRRVTSDATEYLTVGTSMGLWVGALNMLDKGTLRENGAMFNGICESTGALWFASSTGLSGYTLSNGVSGMPKKYPGAMALFGIVAEANAVWATLGSGFTRYDVNAGSWTTWTTMYTKALFGRLVSNEIRSIAITHPVIDGAAREVIWLATASGLNRFDASIPSFTTYTTTDGLPDNSVLKVLGLPNNEVLLATPSGLVIHHGQ